MTEPALSAGKHVLGAHDPVAALLPGEVQGAVGFGDEFAEIMVVGAARYAEA